MSRSLSLVSPACVECAMQQAHIAQRLVLYRGELYRVPTSYRLLRVKSGTAYVTQAGQDHILLRGQETPFEAGADMALVSTVGSEQVVLELFNA